MLDVKIFTDNIDGASYSQVMETVKSPAFNGCKVRIMPDVHAGKGSVIGFTSTFKNKVIPNIVGVDIGCGMLTAKLDVTEIDFERLDNIIRARIPAGKTIHQEETFYPSLDLLNFSVDSELKSRFLKSLGTLGGGNHFIEVDRGIDGYLYLIIHTGSRNLGLQTAVYWQNKAKEYHKKLCTGISEGLTYLEGIDTRMYLEDMQLCMDYAKSNRELILERICNSMDFGYSEAFHTVHNYIDTYNRFIRKGAISARKDQMVLIPLNMKDGCILGTGKGNEDWNFSAPHGAGRKLSRSEAKDTLSVEQFEKEMEGIWTTCVKKSTLDESPMAYKSAKEILEVIEETVEIEDFLTPVYNFKAN